MIISPRYSFEIVSINDAVFVYLWSSTLVNKTQQVWTAMISGREKKKKKILPLQLSSYSEIDPLVKTVMKIYYLKFTSEHQHIDMICVKATESSHTNVVLGKTKIYLHEPGIDNNGGGTILRKKISHHTPIAGEKFLFLSFHKSVIFLPSLYWWMRTRNSQLHIYKRSRM